MARPVPGPREIALLKFLPEELSRDQHALERFQREAQAASALNHPHICTIYDVDESEGRTFIAMELLEGQTLRQRIVRGAFKTDELLEVAIQVADALDAAHAKGKEYYEQAIAVDPNYSLAWYGLAFLYFTLGFFGHMPPKAANAHAGQAARKALELDDMLAEAHAMKGVLRASDYDWKGAEHEFRRALEP